MCAHFLAQILKDPNTLYFKLNRSCLSISALLISLLVLFLNLCYCFLFCPTASPPRRYNIN